MRISEIFLLENLSINVPYHRLTMTIVCLNFYSGNLSRFQYFDCKGNTHQGSFSKIRTPQITLAFHWPAKINKMLMQRRRLIRHSRLANINNTIFI